ncbi:hypothetical protein [Natronorubrum bangense]|uniref:Uncharacterized protein n=2 Tax=Natronorubrum bangense TaxID=61858 RepID=L9WPL9_9EURY|nr:hypothetical protein [Natronorubrum bangense]ELY51337.1 hypothetical protein C494_03295 [Natronorubrum bangense JCM 10635]QCC54683.1 hypothetical protein DV706_09505 [Natronorubrum bangense]
MTKQPPSPTISAGPSLESDDDRVLATTSQLAARIEATIDYQLDEAALEDVLLELDRGDYVRWVTVTQTGDVVWDLTETPDRIAETVAAALVERLHSWLASKPAR